MTRPNSPEVARSPSTLRLEPASAELAPYLFGFVHRDDPNGGDVVRVLPEVRGSIQIMLADPYWLRECAKGAAWSVAPRVALWGPKYNWCYGYAAQHIKAYAVGLTATGLRIVSGRGAPELLNKVSPLSDFNRSLARELTPKSGEAFTAWRRRAASILLKCFEAAPPIVDPIAPALGLLATAESGAVALAAQATGLSERQFRRVFRQLHGVSPKRYQRAVRVDRMIRHLHAAPWETDEFRESPIPFADQPHAIREFRTMTGITPRNYVRAKNLGDATLRSVPVEDMDRPPL